MATNKDNERIVRDLIKLPENLKCMDCPIKGSVYAVLDLATFVCQSCSGIHSNLGRRVKSISMGTFKPEEVQKLKSGGNKVAKAYWLAKWTPSDFPEPEEGDHSKIRQFIELKYTTKRWVETSPTRVEPLSSILGSNIPPIQVFPKQQQQQQQPQLQHQNSFGYQQQQQQQQPQLQHQNSFNNGMNGYQQQPQQPQQQYPPQLQNQNSFNNGINNNGFNQQHQLHKPPQQQQQNSQPKNNNNSLISDLNDIFSNPTPNNSVSSQYNTPYQQSPSQFNNQQLPQNNVWTNNNNWSGQWGNPSSQPQFNQQQQQTQPQFNQPSPFINQQQQQPQFNQQQQQQPQFNQPSPFLNHQQQVQPQSNQQQVQPQPQFNQQSPFMNQPTPFNQPNPNTPFTQLSWDSPQLQSIQQPVQPINQTVKEEKSPFAGLSPFSSLNGNALSNNKNASSVEKNENPFATSSFSGPIPTTSSSSTTSSIGNSNNNNSFVFNPNPKVASGGSPFIVNGNTASSNSPFSTQQQTQSPSFNFNNNNNNNAESSFNFTPQTQQSSFNFNTHPNTNSGGGFNFNTPPTAMSNNTIGLGPKIASGGSPFVSNNNTASFGTNNQYYNNNNVSPFSTQQQQQQQSKSPFEFSNFNTSAVGTNNTTNSNQFPFF
ncbi:Arf GTPase activating protein [Tieghemostelium lacteum]|uniref:Arf GTPase activating protein n=1 Tax=Tieghemostelium lacteum TaxID=361077 RepID=A0A151Z2H5_TIELA|nr:Arf GTPase activating protein [Tieghemostelium lacteum]|eukprot:KYQ88155.1 Arf GTPase activating protein [Tieghemostelium lacteum]